MCNMSSFKHSTVLFTDEDGQPLKFFMRPCAEKQRLRPLIEHGGGVLSNRYTDGMYRLVERGSKILTTSGVCFSSQFIWDCVEKNCLQDMETYKTTIEMAVVSDISEDEASKYTVRTTRRSLRTRNEYSDQDDYTILDYIIKSRRYKETKGRRIWINFQDRKVLPNRTWQSVREHYIKKIIPNIDRYDISEKHKILLSDPFNLNDKKSDTSNLNDDFTFSDDLSILHHLFEADRLLRLHNDDTWKEIEHIIQTCHSWKTLKNRFFKKIIPLLNIYDLSSQQILELKKVVKIPSIVLAVALNKTNKSAKSRNSKRSSSCSESENNAQESFKPKTKQKHALKQPVISDKDESDGSRTGHCAKNKPSDLLEPEPEKSLYEVGAPSSSCPLAHKIHVNKTLNLKTTSPSSSDENSDMSNFEKKCLRHYKFQQTRPKAPIKKLSMKAIQQHVAEIDKSPSRNSSSSLEIKLHEKNLKHAEGGNQQITASDTELSLKESMIPSTPVITHNIIDVLDGLWSEDSDKTTVKLLGEESDGSSSRTAVNVSDSKKAKGTFEMSTTEKLYQNNAHSLAKDIIGAKAKSKEHSAASTSVGIVRPSNDDRGMSSDETGKSFCDKPLKYKRLRRGKRSTNRTKDQNGAQNANSSSRIMPFVSRKRSAVNLITDSEVIMNQDRTLSSSLNIALKYVANIKEKCKDWCDSNNASTVPVPVNSMNSIHRKLDELQAILYKIHLFFSSNEIMKKPCGIDDNDIATLLKFIIVYGNYNFEDISKMFSNKTNHS